MKKLVRLLIILIVLYFGIVIYFRNDGSYHGILEGAPASSSYAVRPVISLNQNVVVSSGNGTANTPYIVRTDAS